MGDGVHGSSEPGDGQCDSSLHRGRWDNSFVVTVFSSESIDSESIKIQHGSCNRRTMEKEIRREGRERKEK